MLTGGSVTVDPAADAPSAPNGRTIAVPAAMENVVPAGMTIGVGVVVVKVFDVLMTITVPTGSITVHIVRQCDLRAGRNRRGLGGHGTAGEQDPLRIDRQRAVVGIAGGADRGGGRRHCRG